MKLSGAEIFIECLRKEKVDVLFGYPGGVVIPIFDKLYDAKDINFYLTRHEQGAVHAADGYARATGKTGVCLATSGPGATNLVTGIATAHMDSIPLVAFTGQVPMSLIGTDAFQEADITGITRPISKHNFLISDTRKMADVISEAFYIASTGRPGPVVVDIPKNVATGIVDFEWPETPSRPVGYKIPRSAAPELVEQAADAIALSIRPLIYVGGGDNRQRCSPGAQDARRETERSCNHNPYGSGWVPREPSSLDRYAGNAWNLYSKYGFYRVRSGYCHRCPFR